MSATDTPPVPVARAWTQWAAQPLPLQLLHSWALLGAGRTARGSQSGLSVALVEPSEQRTYRKLTTELELPDGLPDLPLDTKLL